MGSLGLITAHISKARTPIKTDRAQYGLLGCHSEEQHIQHENQSPPPPISWSGEAVCQPVIGVEPLVNTRALQRAVARPRWEISQGHARKTEICVCPQSSCVCVCGCLLGIRGPVISTPKSR